MSNSQKGNPMNLKCNAPEPVLDPTCEWDWLSDADKDIILRQCGVPCNGNGNITDACAECHYGEVIFLENCA